MPSTHFRPIGLYETHITERWGRLRYRKTSPAGMVPPANTSEGDFVMMNFTHPTQFKHDFRDLTSGELDMVTGGGNSIGVEGEPPTTSTSPRTELGTAIGGVIPGLFLGLVAAITGLI